MKLYVKSNRNGHASVTSYEGMDEAIITATMTDLGHTDIEFLTEEDYQIELASVLAAQ